MRITERLNVEHGVFLRQLEDLDHLVRGGALPAVLEAVVRTIYRAEKPHREIEDGLLYPALAEALGSQYPQLQRMAEEHREIEELTRLIDSGLFYKVQVERFIETLRGHIEREIHLLLPLAEEWIPKEKLEAMCDWPVEHAYERSVERPARWAEKRLG